MGVKFGQKHENKTLSTGGNQTLQIPVGGKIHSLVLHFLTSAGASVTEAQIRSEISNIRLSLGGRDIINCPVTQLLDMYEALGSEVHNNTAVAGVMELNLGRLLYTDPAVRDLFGYGTKDVSSVQVQIQCGTLSAIASVESYTEREFGAAADEVLGTYCRFINYAQSFNGTGEHSVDTLSRDPNTSYLALLIDDGASGTITYSEVRVGGVTLRERIPLNVNKLLLSNNRLEQPSGYFMHAFADGSLSSRLPMINVADFRVVTSFSVAPGAGGYNVTALTVENFPKNIA